jgi:hypothetical protein
MNNIRTVISAQAAYQSANAGYYDTLECLHRPSRCIPGYPADAPVFLPKDLLLPASSGYQFEFHPGPAIGNPPPVASRSSIETYAIAAVPTPGIAEVRSACGDSTGVVCSTVRPRRPQVDRGACVVAKGGPPWALRTWLEDLLVDPPAFEPCYER